MSLPLTPPVADFHGDPQHGVQRQREHGAADENDRPVCPVGHAGKVTPETELEAAIEAAKERMCAADDRMLKLHYWREMCRLMDQRNTPPSESTRIAQASVERRVTAAGGST